MRLIQQPNTVQVSGSLESHKVEIQAANFQRASRMFRDSIYTEKALASIRETVSNSCDEHTKYNIKRLVEVHLPSKSEPYFSSRDYARGLSKGDIFDIFFNPLESTKKNDVKAIGGFGIGTGAAFSVAKEFTVTSYFGGFKSVYVGVDLGLDVEAHLISTEESDEPTGINVSFEIKEDKIYSFNEDFKKFYKNFRNYAELKVLNYDGELPIDNIEDGIVYPEQYQSVVIFKGIAYKHEYKFNNVNFKLKIPDNITLCLHPSRERLVQVEVNENAIKACFDSFSAKMVKEFVDNFPEDLSSQWRYLSSENVKFLHKLGLSRADYPATMGHFTLKKENGFKTYVLSNGEKTSSRATSVGNEVPLVYINRKALSQGMVQTIVEKHPTERIVVICKDHDDHGLEEIKKNLTDYHGKYAAANLVDGTNYIPVRAARIKRPISDKLRVYDFGDREFRRISSKEEKEIVYWTEILQKDIVNTKVIPSHLTQRINARVEFVGVNKSNIKHVPDHWRRVEPIIKSMRRYGDKYGSFDEVANKGIPFKLTHYVNIPKPKIPNWPFKAKKIPKVKLQEFKKYNLFVDSLYNLVHTDEELNIYLAAVAGYALDSKYVPAVKQKIQEKIQKQYEAVQ